MVGGGGGGGGWGEKIQNCSLTVAEELPAGAIGDMSARQKRY